MSISGEQPYRTIMRFSSKLGSFGRARAAWYSKRAFESGAVPVSEISRRLIGAFKKGKQRRIRVRPILLQKPVVSARDA